MEAVLLIAITPALIAALVVSLKTAYHLFYVLMNMAEKCSCFAGSLIWLMPNQSGDDVNKHRKALFPLLIGSILSWLVILIAFIVINVV